MGLISFSDTEIVATHLWTGSSNSFYMEMLLTGVGLEYDLYDYGHDELNQLLYAEEITAGRFTSMSFSIYEAATPDPEALYAYVYIDTVHWMSETSQFLSSPSLERVEFGGPDALDDFLTLALQDVQAAEQHRGNWTLDYAHGDPVNLVISDSSTPPLSETPLEEIWLSGPTVNEMRGGAGDDVLFSSGLGRDTLLGGEGADVFVINLYDQTVEIEPDLAPGAAEFV